MSLFSVPECVKIIFPVCIVDGFNEIEENICRIAQNIFDNMKVAVIDFNNYICVIIECVWHKITSIFFSIMDYLNPPTELRRQINVLLQERNELIINIDLLNGVINDLRHQNEILVNLDALMEERDNLVAQRLVAQEELMNARNELHTATAENVLLTRQLELLREQTIPFADTPGSPGGESEPYILLEDLLRPERST